MGKLLAVLMMVLLIAAPATATEPTTTTPNQDISQEQALQAGSTVDETSCLEVIGEYPEELSVAQGGCCKVCRKGKACGDSCISRNYNCSRPRGCACDG